MGAGALALALLADPLNASLLQALADGPRSLVELRVAVGSPPQTTVRTHLAALSELAILVKHRRNDFPGSIDYELAPAGRELLGVAAAVRAWLATAPGGSSPFASIAAQSAIKALVEGWSTNMLRALAARPLSLTELGSLLTGISYPSIERRLAAMRLAGQVEAMPGDTKGTPYTVTRWTRRAIGPLAAAARWEELHLLQDTTPIGSRGAEAVFLLAMPLIELEAEISGRCRLGIEVGDAEFRGLAGVMVAVERGRVVSCFSRLEGDPEAAARGKPTAWFTALLEGDPAPLDLHGEASLAAALVKNIHSTLVIRPRSPR